MESPKSSQHFMATVRIGPKGQIVIPKEVRDMFGVEPGDCLLLMADTERGIALQRQDVMEKIASAIFLGQGASLYPEEAPDALAEFARSIQTADGEGRS